MIADNEAWLREKGELYRRIGQDDYRERMVEAADEIERLRVENARLREGLEAAYREGFAIGDYAGGGNASTFALEQSWQNSCARTLLAKAEGDRG